MAQEAAEREGIRRMEAERRRTLLLEEAKRRNKEQ